MAQFDVYIVDGAYLLDCQSDFLSGLATRLVVPLLDSATAPKPAARLNPMVVIKGQSFVVMTQYLAAVPTRILGNPVASLSDHNIEIIGAIDFLLTGF